MFELEPPDNNLSWKSYCKKKFSIEEILWCFRSLCIALNYLHSNGIVHWDVHPTWIHVAGGIPKFNFIGMPYNFKKLLKKDNFSGHVNYSCPELVLE